MGEVLTHGQQVKARIIEAGLKLWRMDPASVTARKIGKELEMTHGACLYHYGSAEKLKNAIAEAAVDQGDRQIVPMLITSNHPAVASMSAIDRDRFLSGF